MPATSVSFNLLATKVQIGRPIINLALPPVSSSWVLKLPSGTKLSAYAINDENCHKSAFVGVDPGSRHMGLAIIDYGRIVVYEIEYQPKLQTVEIVERTREAIEYILDLDSINTACVEGAAFGAGFGQAKLSESKTAAVMTLLDIADRVFVVPPLSVYKEVFGSGKIKAKTYQPWSHIPKNAASALALAIYAERL